MSFFDTNVDEIKQSIQFFNQLSRERQATIVSSPTQEDLYKDDEWKQMLPFLSAILNDISRYSQPQLTHQIVELGMEQTFAQLFVNNIIKDAPTLAYQITLLSKIDDDVFEKMFPKLVNFTWIERKTNEIMMSELDISQEEINAGVDIFRKGINSILRSDASDGSVRSQLKESGFSDSKCDTFFNTIKINSEYWRNFLVFSNTQDTFFAVSSIENKNNEILRILKEILLIFKEIRAPDEHGHFQ